MTYKSDINESFLKDFKQIEELLNRLETKIAGIKEFIKEAEEIIKERQNE
jgi:BMFP domain-containing protein YqiC